MQKLTEWMELTETSQQALGERLGVSRAAVGQWLSGKTMPSAATLMKLRDVTGLSIDRLLADKERAA